MNRWIDEKLDSEKVRIDPAAKHEKSGKKGLIKISFGKNTLYWSTVYRYGYVNDIEIPETMKTCIDYTISKFQDEINSIKTDEFMRKIKLSGDGK